MAWYRKSDPVRISRSLQKALLDALAAPVPKEAATPTLHPATPISQQHTPPAKSKRQLEEDEALPAKRQRLLDSPPSEPPSLPSLAHPQSVFPAVAAPTAKKRSYASFLQDAVEPIHDAPPPAYAPPFVTEWLASLNFSARRPNACASPCRSDSFLYCSGGPDDLDAADPINRTQTKSAPVMSDSTATYVDGFLVPPVPPKRPMQAISAITPESGDRPMSGGSSFGRSLVEGYQYRQANLRMNHIRMMATYLPLPTHVAQVVGDMSRDRDLPGPSIDAIEIDRELSQMAWEGASESDVETYFGTNLFCKPAIEDSLFRSVRQPMARYSVPKRPTAFLKISNPVPDMLFGYNGNNAFTDAHGDFIALMGNVFVANSNNQSFPFLSIEFKGDGPGSSGSLWVATNQCLGAAAACVYTAERLNDTVRQVFSDGSVSPIDSTAFSIAMSGTEARLYVAWKDDTGSYLMQTIRAFLLQDPEHYRTFHRYVHNILDWGRGRRLLAIRQVLDSLVENRLSQAVAAAAAASAAEAAEANSEVSGEARADAARGRAPHLAGPGGGSRGRSRGSSRGRRGSRGSSLGPTAKRARSSSSASVLRNDSVDGGGDRAGDATDFWQWDDVVERFYHVKNDGTLLWGPV